MRLVANSDELSNYERLAVHFAESSISICLGSFGMVRQDVGDDALVALGSGVIDGGISSRAKPLEDGEGPRHAVTCLDRLPVSKSWL